VGQYVLTVNATDGGSPTRSSSTTVTIDPLGTRHSDSGSLSSKAGSISLSAKYNQNDRTVVITAKRGGVSIGEYSWRVEAVLR
jgi:hypothetical protein